MFAVMGEALMDLIITDNGDVINAFYGGGPFNTSLALARLGHKTYFHYPISQDYYGRRFMALLNDNNILYSCPYQSPSSTPLAMVHLDNEGKADYRFYRQGTADRDLRMPLLQQYLPDDVTVLHTGTLAIAERQDVDIIYNIARNARDKGKMVSVDPNIRARHVSDGNAYIECVKTICNIAHIIKLSDEDIGFLYPNTTIDDAINIMVQQYVNCDLLVVTAGKNKIKAKTKHHDISFTPPNGDIAGDTIGAGDCFIAGLLHQCNDDGLLSPERIKNITQTQLYDIVRFAHHIAYLNCQSFGCNPPLISALN